MPTASAVAADNLARKLTDFLETRRTDAVSWAYRHLNDWGDAEDCVQEAAIRAYMAISRGEFDTSRDVKPWFNVILFHTAHNMRRNQASRERREQEALWRTLGDRIASEEMNPEEEVLRKAEAESALRPVRQAMQQLSAPERALLTRTYGADRRPAEVAAEVGVRSAVVRSRLYRARKTLLRLIAIAA